MTQTKVEAPFVENNRPFRNLIINGDMQVAQRATAATTSGDNNGSFHTLDRWAFYNSLNGAYTSEQHDMSLADLATTGQAHALELNCTTADTSVAAGDYAAVYQRIEAQNLQHLKWGTSSAKSLTLSFWGKSNLAGSGNPYSIYIHKHDSTGYLLPIQYYFASADTWEKITINISPTAGSTTLITNSAGVINNDTGAGIGLFFNLVWGTDYTAAASGNNNLWNTTNYALDEDNNFLSSTSNNLYITGVQLEVGDQATDFEHLPYDVQLQRCHRYFFRSGGNVAYEMSGVGVVTVNSRLTINVNHPVPMRAAPSLSVNNVANFRIAPGAQSDAANSISLDIGGINTSMVNCNQAGTDYTTGHAGRLINENNTNASLDLSAEL